MRIAFIADPQSPNGWYRGIGPMVALAQRGHEIRQVDRVDGQFRGDLVRGCDVVHIHRRHDEEALAVVRHAKASGIAIVWDNDDDLSAVPKTNVAYRRYGGARGERAMINVRKVVAQAELVTTPSAVLAEKFRSYNAVEVRLIENYLRDETVHVRPVPGNGRVVVGWVAGMEHHLDVEQLPIRTIMQQLLADHSEVSVVTIGVGLGIRDERYEHIPRLRFEHLPERVARFDIGIAPLTDIAMNHARSNVKVKEYAALGVPWLASNLGPYVGLGEKQGGRLVADGEWHAALERLIVKERERRKLAKRALSWGRAQTISANAGQWEAALQAAVERARSGATGTL